jgi:hypothetical protein
MADGERRQLARDPEEIYTHVMKGPGLGVTRPFDGL